MSAVAHNNIEQTNLASVQLNGEPAVTPISVSARIDYIQRFSKQAVLVIDQDTNVYTQAARQYLINLSKDKAAQEANVAFVSASTKLNDIQMRCRLIEQLFSNTLFDPEKSLAVSILNLSQKAKDNITIVVEHAHSLSLQIKYELCQLVDVANKTQGKINVAFFGLEKTAQDAANNKSIFKNKLVVLDAKSGQLIPLDHAKFKNENAIFTRKFWFKLIATVVTAAMLIGLSWFVLIEHDSFSLSQLPIKFMTEPNITIEKEKGNESEVPLVESNQVVVPTSNELAGSSDIYAAIQGESLVATKDEIKKAQVADILQALSFSIVEEVPVQEVPPQALQTGILTEKTDLDEVIEIPKETLKIADKAVETTLSISKPSDYYLNFSSGFVVQIVGFTDEALVTRFGARYPNLKYYSYQKVLNEQVFTVLTTQVYDKKEQAREALLNLPKEIIDRGVWVKEVSAVQEEIDKS